MSFNRFDSNGKPVYQEREARSSCAPETSYWIDSPLDGWTAHVQRTRLNAMRHSRFGDPDASVITDATMGEAAGTRLNRQKRATSGYATLGMRI